MNATHFGLEVAEAVASVTLTGAERKNPLTFESYAELRDTFRAFATADDVDAVVITGEAGNFSSGGDVRHHRAADADGHGRAARVHAHDGRLGQGDPALPAARHRRRRRDLRRRRERRSRWPATCGSAPRAPRSRSCSRASGWPAPTWASARCSAHHRPGADGGAALHGALDERRGGRRWGFFNRLV